MKSFCLFLPCSDGGLNLNHLCVGQFDQRDKPRIIRGGYPRFSAIFEQGIVLLPVKQQGLELYGFCAINYRFQLTNQCCSGDSHDGIANYVLYLLCAYLRAMSISSYNSRIAGLKSISSNSVPYWYAPLGLIREALRCLYGILSPNIRHDAEYWKAGALS